MSSVSERVCKVCGKTFVPKNPRQLNCSPECASAAKKLYGDAWRKEQRAKAGLEPLEGRTCAKCGAKFDALQARVHLCRSCMIEEQKRRDKESHRRCVERKRRLEKALSIPHWLHTSSRTIPLLKHGRTVEEIVRFRFGDEPTVEEVLRMPVKRRELYAKGWMQSEKGAALAVLEGRVAI